ncbi:hypothetical protein RJ41_14065, partial [Alteromonas marina]
MIIDDIISDIELRGQGGPRSYYAFEAFVQHLLKHHIKAQNKRLSIESEVSKYGDAFAPNGFDEFDGATLIEVKFNLSRLPARYFIEKSIYGLLNEYADSKFEHALFISAKPIPEKFKIRAEEEINTLNLPFKVTLWGPAELNKIAYANRKAVNNIVKNLFALRLSSAISKPSNDWKINREDIIKNLKACYKKGQFSLFLGAGVSSSAGMPDWSKLLSSLFVTYLTQEFGNDIEMGDKDISDLVERLHVPAH